MEFTLSLKVRAIGLSDCVDLVHETVWTPKSYRINQMFLWIFCLHTLNESRDSAAEVYWLPEVRRHVAGDVGAEPGPGHVWHVGGGHWVRGQVVIHVLRRAPLTLMIMMILIMMITLRPQLTWPGVRGSGEGVPVRPLEVPANQARWPGL